MSHIIQVDKAYKASLRVARELDAILRLTQHHLRNAPYQPWSNADNVFFWAEDRVINAHKERIHKLSQSS